MAKKNWIKIEREFATSPQHRIDMGMRIWLYLYILDRADWETGKINNWRDQDAADEMEIPIRTIRDQRQGLEEAGYIQCIQRGQYQVIIIFNYHNPRAYDGEILNLKSDFTPVPIFEGDNILSPEEEKGTNILSLEPKGDTQGDTEGNTQGDSKSVTLPLISHITIPENQDTLDARELWTSILQELSFNVRKADYDTWIRTLVLISGEESTLTVGCSNPFQKQFVDSKYASTIERIIQRHWTDGEFRTIIYSPDYGKQVSRKALKTP
ncbi:MAG: hypothetical protein M0R06_08310 [Sphaerochaeta sp.]|jgi:hypothetical protein|nr:hypothetical protein [Sphaerochaeta sp.]